MFLDRAGYDSIRFRDSLEQLGVQKPVITLVGNNEVPPVGHRISHEGRVPIFDSLPGPSDVQRGQRVVWIGRLQSQ